MLPEIGATELLVLAAVALIVVGPKDLPMLLRKLGSFVARLRGMAAEFRTSFDDMARQSELEDLRKEVAAMRDSAAAESGQVTSTLTDINKALHDDISVAELDGSPTGAAEPYDPNYQLYGEEIEPVLRPEDVAPRPAPKAPKPKTTISKVAAPEASTKAKAPTRTKAPTTTTVAQAAPEAPPKPARASKPRAPRKAST